MDIPKGVHDMQVKTFKGGTHPPEKKELAKDVPIEYYLSPKQVVIHLNQHTGHRTNRW